MAKKIDIWVVLVFIFCLSCFFGCKGTDIDNEPERIRLATGGTIGTYYAYGTVLARILAEKTNIDITVYSSGASKANIQLIAADEVEMAIAQNDVMDCAWQGVDLFAGEQTQSFNAMAALYAEVVQLVANPAAGIGTIEDLRGKNVSVGDVGSGTEFNARQILEVYGIGFNDINKRNLGFGLSIDALRDDEIDAFFCVAGAPTPGILDLAMDKEVIILDVDDAHAAQLSESYPFYTQFQIPDGSYPDQAGIIKTVAVKATLIVSSKVSENTVYQLTKALFENKTAIANAHAKGSEISAAYAVDGIPTPFHPGAFKYFKEVGVIE